MGFDGRVSGWATGKLPQVTLVFWIMKVAATTLGETAGDLLAQTLRVGYLVSSAILVGLFLVSVVAQLAATAFHPVLYWTVIVSTSTAGTTMSDFMNRTVGLGYARGALVLITALAVVFVVWALSGHPFAVGRIDTFGGELLYWTAILLSNTLGTSLGDFLADATGLGFGGTALVISGVLALTAGAMRWTAIPNTLLFWVAFVLTRPLGASAGDFVSKPVAVGGLGYGTVGASVILGTVLVALIVYTSWQLSRSRTAGEPFAAQLPDRGEVDGRQRRAQCPVQEEVGKLGVAGEGGAVQVGADEVALDDPVGAVAVADAVDQRA
jgi:uncharacterized membrane-anchored protein